jgi:hypothetical protein
MLGDVCLLPLLLQANSLSSVVTCKSYGQTGRLCKHSQLRGALKLTGAAAKVTLDAGVVGLPKEDAISRSDHNDRFFSVPPVLTMHVVEQYKELDWTRVDHNTLNRTEMN